MKLLILSLILLVLFTVVNCEPCKLKQPICPQVEGTEHELTVLPVIVDCTKYILCQRGIPIVRPCPGELIFNAELGVCDFPNRTECIQCEEDDEAITEPDTPSYRTTTASSDAISTTADTLSYETSTETTAV